MARIALAVAGGIIGAVIGGPAGAELGFSLGNILGAALFPPKLPTQYGPRLNDKQVTSAADGEPIPWGYGGFRIAGNIIWAAPIKEIKNTQHQSAKGGPTQTTVSYTYTCSFAIAFCEGPGTILRIWADSKLIYDTTGKTAVTLDTGVTSSGGVAQTVRFTPTIYPGDNLQGPDPTIQAALGIGSTPGYRGLVYAVFTDFPLADFGNRIPSIRAEISTGNVTTYVKSAYRAMSTVENQGTMSPAVSAASHAAVDSVNRIGYFWEVHGQAVMAIDLNVEGSTPLTTWTANNVQNIGDQILDSNGNVQYAISVTGDQKTGATHPVWQTVDGLTTADHHVTWMKVGVGPNAVVVLREGLLDPTTTGFPLSAPGQFGANNDALLTVDTRGNLWGVAFLNDPRHPSAEFAVRYDPISFKATGVVPMNIFNGIPPSIISMVPARVGGVDKMYITLSSSGGAPEALAIIDCKTLLLDGYGILYRNSLFGDTTHFFSGSNVQLYPAIDQNTGIAYYLLNDAVRPIIGLTTWYIMKIDPRSGWSQVPVPTWGFDTGQWNNTEVFSFAINLPANATDGYPHSALFDVSDNTLLCFSSSQTSFFTNVKKIDCVLGTLITNTSLTSSAYSNDADIQTYLAPGYRGQVPGDGLVKLLGPTGKTIVYIRSSDLVIANTVNLNNWEPALGGSNDFFTAFAYDTATNSALLTPSSYSPIPLRFFFDRQAVQAEPLDQVVSDLLQRAGVSTSNIDVTALSGINCLGYVVARTSDAKAALQPLCTAFFFDLVETDFKIKAVLRGQAASQNIPETDLGIIDDQYKLVETIAQEQDLPKTVSVEYQDPALNYQQGKQHKYRSSRVKKTKNHDVLQLPITMNADNAAQVADKYLAMLWAERNMYDFKLWASKYLVVDPTDVVQFTYNGLPFQARIVKSSLGQNKILEISGVSEDARQYLSILGGSGTTGFQNGTILPAGATLLFFYDIPLLQDIDDNYPNTGFYYLMSSPTLSTWPGGNLYQSGDNFQTSVTLDSDFDEATYGVVITATPDAAFAPNAAGNTVLHPFSWDYITTVTVRLAQGSLASTTELAVLNGANAFILGSEVMQFQNAVLNSDGTYTLSKLLRGRRGTETSCHFHLAGETFVLLNSATKRIQQSASIIGLLREYKAVTIGQTVTSGTTESDVLAANDLMPYAPAQFQGGLDGSNNLNITWQRRTRVGGAWFDGIGEVPLSEQSEGYDLDIMVLNYGGTRRVPYTIAPTTLSTGPNLFFNNVFGVSQVPATFVYDEFAPSNPWHIKIKPFSITWEDGVVANYAFGTDGGGLDFHITGGAGNPVATYGTSLWVHDPLRQGTNNISDFGFDNNVFPDGFTANGTGYFQLTFFPGTINFPAGTPVSTIAVHALAGDCAVRSFIGLSAANVLYTDAQIKNDFSRNELTSGPGFLRAKVYQKSAIVGRGFAAENVQLGIATTSGGSDATSILGVPITGTPLDGDILQYNASANEWQIVGPLLKAQSIVKTTAPLANGAIEQGSISVACKTFVLLQVTGDRSCRVQLYDTNADATADASRPNNTPPEPLTENGIMADTLLTQGGAETFKCAPPLVCTNNDSPRAQTIYYRITNNSGSSSTVQVTLLIIPIEL